jgi:hypothetical protein
VARSRCCGVMHYGPESCYALDSAM